MSDPEMTSFGRPKISVTFGPGYVAYLALLGAKAVLSFTPPEGLVVQGIEQQKQDFTKLHTMLTEHAPSPAHIPCVVVAEEDENHDEFYTVQVMTVPNQSGSFVTETIRPGHALYNFFLERVGALNMAGDFEEIEGVGENLSRKHYNVYISAEQHASICSLGAREEL